MSLNIFNEDDEPLFALADENDAESARIETKSLSLQEYNSKQENSRKNKVLSFCFRASKWVLLFAVFLICADLYAQAHGWDTTLVKDCLSLVTYIVTAALGFIFGSNSK